MNYSGNDLRWNLQGDFEVAPNGDLADTNQNPLLWLFQCIRDRLGANLGDWKLYPTLCANLDDFVGEAITNRLQVDLRNRISSAITLYELVSPSDIEVLSVPVGDHMVMVRIILSVTINGKPTRISFSYSFDTIESRISYLGEKIT